MRPDPEVRTDGRCALASCRKPVAPERWRKYAAGEQDPFCSTDCCRAWHRCPRRASGPHSGELSRTPMLGRSPDPRVGSRSRYVRQGPTA